MAQPPTSQLLSLPYEIRTEIYRYLLVLPNHWYWDLRGRGRTASAPGTSAERRPAMALLLASRQLHDEASQILYSENTFLAHPTLLASFPSLRAWYAPVRESSAAARIRRWHVRVRLDCDPPYDAETVAAAFSGCDELTVEVWQAMFRGADHDVLCRFAQVRGVRKARVFGSVWGFEDYAAWLERAMCEPIAVDSDDGGDTASVIGGGSGRVKLTVQA